MNAKVEKLEIGPNTLVRGVGLGQIAQDDPQLAISLYSGLIRPDEFGVCEPRCGAGSWEIINISGCFNSGAIQTVEGVVCGITTDMWICDIRYTVRRPNAFAGNIFKAQSDFYNAKNPNIDFTLQIKSYCNYLISPDPTPIENIEHVFSKMCPTGFVIGCNAIISAEFTNRRTFEDDEIPTEVVITFHAVRLPTSYLSCTRQDAVRKLLEAGILTAQG